MSEILEKLLISGQQRVWLVTGRHALHYVSTMAASGQADQLTLAIMKSLASLGSLPHSSGRAPHPLHVSFE